jgi:hypothetical protein
MVFTQTAIREFRGSDSLELPELLPGFTMPLVAVFGPLNDSTPLSKTEIVLI